MSVRRPHPADPRRRHALAALLGSLAVPAVRAAPEPAVAVRDSIRTSDGVRLSRLVCRPASPTPGAPTVVLLPGWCMPARIWDAQLRVLGAAGPTVALDPRGQGESEVAARGYTADRRADDLHDALADLGEVVLVAWSLGVLEALQYVHRHGSGRLLGLALVDNSIGEPPPPKGSDFIVRLRRAREATMDSFVRSMFAHPPPAPLLEAVRASALRLPLEDSIALLSYPLPREHWRGIVHGFDRPLAYLVTPRWREQAQNLLRARPEATVEIFEGAGHALFVDEPDRFNGRLMAWMGSLASP